jgi:hypothetical protein
MLNIQAGTTDNQIKAANTIAAHQVRIEAIRSDPALSPEGKRNRMAGDYITTQATVARLQVDEQAAASARRTTLERDLFGLPGFADASAAISYRDAQDRAAGITDEHDALRLLSQADLSGDDHLAKAVALRSIQESWPNVSAAYAAARPGVAAKMQELANMATPGIADSLSAAWAYYLPAPNELAGIPAQTINELAHTDTRGV